MIAKEALDILVNSKAHPEYALSIAYNTLKNVIDELEELKKRDVAMKPVEAMITWQCGKCGKEIRNTFNSCPYCRTRIDWSSVYGSEKDE